MLWSFGFASSTDTLMDLPGANPVPVLISPSSTSDSGSKMADPTLRGEWKGPCAGNVRRRREGGAMIEE